MDVLRKLAKALASNQDKVRRKAQKQVKVLLSKKSFNGKDDWTYEQLLGICKGLHYSLWMQDKLLLKEQTVVRLCNILPSIEDSTVTLYYSYAMFETLAREWDNLDYWRVDKFMLLGREFFTRGLQFISCKKPEILPSFIEAIFTKILNNDINHAVGLKIHFCTLIGEELPKKNVKMLSVQLVFQYLLVLLASLPKHNIYAHSVLSLITRLTKLIRRRPQCCLDGIMKCLENILSKDSSYRNALKRVDTNLKRTLANREATSVATDEQVPTLCTESSPETTNIVPNTCDNLSNEGGSSELKIGKKKIPKVSKRKKPMVKKRLCAETTNVNHYLLSNYFQPVNAEFSNQADSFVEESCPKRMKSEISTKSVDECTAVPDSPRPFSTCDYESKPNVGQFISPNVSISGTPASEEKCTSNTPSSERRVSFGKVFRKKFNSARCISLTPPVSVIPAKGILRSNSK
ncbi:unnamed protein product [Schistosoma rodhaini]|uniref:Uncharacterized protein n=1 Tax=Schistosoma rodhaini TaxID=6188 RepID=A0AA85FNQ2_9TREM|nr:unnamed protein product [Schistosoma rodhaini]